MLNVSAGVCVTPRSPVCLALDEGRACTALTLIGFLSLNLEERRSMCCGAVVWETAAMGWVGASGSRYALAVAREDW